jgi:YHS domain-containing protein
MLREMEIPPEQQTAPKDLVCGMAVDPTKSHQTAVYAGSNYLLCSAGCRTSFEAGPATYAQAASSDAGLPVAHSADGMEVRVLGGAPTPPGLGNPQVGNNDIASDVKVVMGRFRLLLILAVLVLANLVRGPTGVLASCAVTPQLATAISDAPAVFVGKVTSVDHAGRVADVHVDDVWKGRVAATVQVVGTPDLNAGATSVDRYYDVGQKYLFIPFSGSGNGFQDNNCSLTQPYSAALAGFRPSNAVGLPPAPGPLHVAAQPPIPEASSWAPFALAGGLILLVIVIPLVIAKRRRHDASQA